MRLLRDLHAALRCSVGRCRPLDLRAPAGSSLYRCRRCHRAWMVPLVGNPLRRPRRLERP